MFNGLGKDNCKTRCETFRFWDLDFRDLTVVTISSTLSMQHIYFSDVNNFLYFHTIFTPNDPNVSNQCA